VQLIEHVLVSGKRLENKREVILENIRLYYFYVIIYYLEFYIVFYLVFFFSLMWVSGLACAYLD